MGRRSAVEALPKKVKEWLDRALAEGGFARYALLSDELKARGYEISKSAVHRYGRKFEERLASLKMATEQARAIVEAPPDEEGAMNEALMRLVQERLFGVLQDIQVDPEKVNITSITKSIAELGRASVGQKKWMAEARRQALEEAAEAADRVARKHGLSEDARAALRAELGIEA